MHLKKRRKKVRRINKLRLAAWLLVLVMVSSGIRLVSGQAGVQESKASYGVHRVREGETLWGLAQDLKDQGEDTRDYVDQLRQINKLDDAKIYPGQDIYYLDPGLD